MAAQREIPAVPRPDEKLFKVEDEPTRDTSDLEWRLTALGLSSSDIKTMLQVLTREGLATSAVHDGP